MDGSITTELRKSIYDIVGVSDGKKIIDLLLRFGVSVITPVSSVDIKLPSIEIQTISPTGKPLAQGTPIGLGAWDVARRHLFECKVNGEQNPMIQRVEIDPFDYNDAEILKVRLTLIPIGIEKEEKDHA